ncbi:MAG TPA: alpha-glucan family phosphorylase [Bacteroidia bacterium]|nr:alpha-glucan family phosphorylase [Bacteroidia bacterium]
MKEETLSKPDYILEVSWEVCNKVGGIYTVISTKALTLVHEFGDKYILIGPDVWKGTWEHPEFAEDKELLKSWRPHAEARGLKIKIGRWKIAGNPIVVLVDFTSFFSSKEKIFEELWLNNKLDSINGQWDYIEPALFGYAAGKVIECFNLHYVSFSDRVVAQFHEWMTGAGILFLHQHVPQIGTIFTTHATVIGRCLAGNNLPLYSKFDSYDAEQKAKEYNVVAKHSLEKLSAKTADCFTTVSDITAKECVKFLEKKPDVITPNGFEFSFVPDPVLFRQKRITARRKLFDVANKLLNKTFDEDTLLVLKSGRYEFHNKGIDLFIDALGMLKQEKIQKEVLAFIFVPAYNTGPRKELQENFSGNNSDINHNESYLTHYIQGTDTDLIIQRIKKNNLDNHSDDNVNVIFAPTYMDGHDGIFNMNYFDLLIGFDLGVFPSYYEPWGYTPVEALAFHVPTVTTNRTGFGMLFTNANKAIFVLERNDDNETEVTKAIADVIKNFSGKSIEEIKEARETAFLLSKKTLWKNLIVNYQNAYALAFQKAKERELNFTHEYKPAQYDACSIEHSTPRNNQPQWRKIFVHAEFPESLLPLKKLSRNLWWTWNEEAQELFSMMDEELWKTSGKNPVALIENLSYDEIKNLETNKSFLDKLKSVSEKFENYLNRKVDATSPLIAYFSMEYGLHCSIKIYSGGLGVLAGDYLKQASDSSMNLIAVGLLYRNGYFRQRLTINGDQIAENDLQKFTNLPMQPVMNEDGDRLKITIPFPGRTLYAQAWQMNVGITKLFLLDTDMPENASEDRHITSQLYGGNWENRLCQEILLGIGGVRLLNMMGYKPDVYHLNEGHAAFASIERINRFILEQNISFDEAFEVIRASSLFTTHTPVEAGHDKFSEDLMRKYFSHYPQVFNISWEKLISLGKAHPDDSEEKFSMSFFAAHFSQKINAVSKIHGEVSRKMFSKLWDGYGEVEIPVGYVTNGVHLPTWMANEWKQLYSKKISESILSEQLSTDSWNRVFKISDHEIWQTHCALKKKLISVLKEKIKSDLLARHDSPEKLMAYEDALNEQALFVGFARRFASYKRPELLFKNLNVLREIVNDKERPLIFIFSGKAHPNDVEAQQHFKNIFKIISEPDLNGKIIFLENYNMEIAKHLVQGVDLWLNTPVRGEEASGTSGMKASLNGVLNLSVKDGWYPEAYNENSGWALPDDDFNDAEFRNKSDAEQIYRILKNEIAPLYFERNNEGVPVKWIQKMKHAVAEIAPAFNSERMLVDYREKYYQPLNMMHRDFADSHFEKTKKLVAWKQKIMKSWGNVKVLSVNALDSSNQPFPLGKNLSVQIALDTNGLDVSDLGVEIIFRNKKESEINPEKIVMHEDLVPAGIEENKVSYECSIPLNRSGVYEYGFRVYPKSDLLAQRMDLGLLKWI